MKQNEKTVSSTRRAARIQTAETAVCGICLVLCVCVLFYAFRMYRTTKEMLRTATAVPPTVLWYEDAAQSAQNVVSDEPATTPQTENAPQTLCYAYDDDKAAQKACVSEGGTRKTSIGGENFFYIIEP